MKSFLKKIYANIILGYWVFHLPKKIQFMLMSDEKYIKKRYQKTFGRKLNLNNPRLFTEKIQWLKLNEKNPLLSYCADKFKVKDYVKDKVGEDYSIHVVFYTKNPQDINVQNLPDYPVIIKTNHDSGGAIVINNKYDVNFADIQKSLSKKLTTNYYYLYREWEYKNIEPLIIVEKLLKDESGNEVLNDYKIHCLNGEPVYIQTIFDRKTVVTEDWYDTNWNIQDVYYFSPVKKHVPRPDLLNKMLELAKILSQDFIYVRVDMYISEEKIYIGELTFRPYAGFMKFVPEEFDEILGRQLHLN